ncbi:hypothetical protein [Clostridium estertheticum]|uniref:hypothetical protein n=1 Tax=Clostridium estertheticum TaxID=238834 RepID=UPI001CF4FFE1|nr:hypothetical protein [Clostridium estertheticum]MCB2360166.1 hypothetical protein [Clostridium estertheticum]
MVELLGLAIWIAGSSNTSSRVSYEEAIEKIKTYNNYDIKYKNKGVIGKLLVSCSTKNSDSVKQANNANIYFEVKYDETNSRIYHITYFCNKERKPSGIKSKCISLGPEFSVFLKNHKVENIQTNSDLEKYIKLIIEFCHKIYSLTTE